MPLTNPSAFMCYDNQDDDDNEGKLTTFRDKLERAVGLFTAEDFRIFQDEVYKRWGDRWQDQVVNALDEAVFFIPIITPRFFKSTTCQLEFKLFLERQQKLAQQNPAKPPGIICPIYYIDYKPLNDPNHTARNHLVEAISANHHIDWRGLRHIPFSNTKVKLTIDAMAQRIRDVLDDLQRP